MSLITLIKNLIEGSKNVDIFTLPTKGYFYPKDFILKIKKAKDEDIIEYEFKYDSDNIMEVVECVKKIVQKNIILNTPYQFEDLKSVDIIFIFLEIVKFTTKKTIQIEFFNDESSSVDLIEFSSKNFAYFNFDTFKELHNPNENIFEIDGYKFSMPSVGVENCLAQYLLSKSNTRESEIFTNLSYDFLFFLGNKSSLTFNEIENLITIFNYDIDELEKDKIKGIIELFMGMIGYQLRFKNYFIDVKTNINLEKIWKI